MRLYYPRTNTKQIRKKRDSRELTEQAIKAFRGLTATDTCDHLNLKIRQNLFPDLLKSNEGLEEGDPAKQ